jgi:cytochrome c oxidase cbb3-type subunit 4
MYKEVLRTIVGIEMFPVLSLVIFLAVFLVMLVWVLRMDRQRLATYASLPLGDDPVTPTKDRPHPDTLRGARL